MVFQTVPSRCSGIAEEFSRVNVGHVRAKDTVPRHAIVPSFYPVETVSSVANKYFDRITNFPVLDAFITDVTIHRGFTSATSPPNIIHPKKNRTGSLGFARFRSVSLPRKTSLRDHRRIAWSF